MSNGGAARPYDSGNCAQWLTNVAAWRWQSPDERTRRLAGDCPRCGHPMAAQIEVTTTVWRAGEESPELPKEVFVACNCLMPHEGRPNGERGCGCAGVFAGPLS